jgi:hypothetical protein
LVRLRPAGFYNVPGYAWTLDVVTDNGAVSVIAIRTGAVFVIASAIVGSGEIAEVNACVGIS